MARCCCLYAVKYITELYGALQADEHYGEMQPSQFTEQDGLLNRE